MKKRPPVTGLVVCLLAACWTTPQQNLTQAADDPVASAYVQRMMTLDRNRDGFLSASELPATLASLMTSHDQNSDRKLSPEELAVQEQAMRNQRDPQNSDDNAAPGGRRAAGRRGAGNPGGPGRGRTSAGGSPLDAAQILRFALTFDADGDGGLNAEELKRYANALAARRGQARAKHGSVPALQEKSAAPDAPNRDLTNPPSDAKSSIPPRKGLGADGRGDGGFGDDSPQK